MGIAKQLYQLQEVELEIEADEQTLSRLLSQLGDNRAIVEVQAKLTSEQRRLDELKRRLHSIEWEIDELVSKIKNAEEMLYSGRIRNPKELTNLQHEVNLLKAKRDQLENGALEIMNQVELAEANVANTSSEFKKLEAEWQNQQQQLSIDIEDLKSKLSDLKQRRQIISAEIEPQAIGVYDKIKRQKGQAVAKVEQGICRGCLISLPFTELQQARSGHMVQCSSCGRILFLP